MINPRQVRSLIAVQEAGSVTAAAARLHLAPSTVSAQLRELGDQLGLALLEPVGRGVSLSAAARNLLPAMRDYLRAGEETLAQARALAGAPAGRLRLYAPSSMCVYRLPPLIEKMQGLAPDVEIVLQHDPFDWRGALDQRRIDAAVLVSHGRERALARRRIAAEPVVYVGAPALVSDARLSLATLAERALITTEPDCSYRREAAHHWSQAGLKLRPRQQFSNVEVIRRCLLAGMGIGLLPRCVVEDDLRSGALREQAVVGAPYALQSWLVWRAAVPPGPALQLFADAIGAGEALV